MKNAGRVWATRPAFQRLAARSVRVHGLLSAPPRYFVLAPPDASAWWAVQCLTWLTDVFIDFATCFSVLPPSTAARILSHDAACFDASAGDANSRIPTTISPVFFVLMTGEPPSLAPSRCSKGDAASPFRRVSSRHAHVGAASRAVRHSGP
jgi:hypothetical protein